MIITLQVLLRTTIGDCFFIRPCHCEGVLACRPTLAPHASAGEQSPKQPGDCFANLEQERWLATTSDKLKLKKSDVTIF